MNPFLWGNPAAVGQQTAAGRVIIGSAAGNGVRGKRKRRAKTKTAARSRRTNRAMKASKRGKAPRLVKGSAAAKAYMAKIRRKRKK